MLLWCAKLAKWHESVVVSFPFSFGEGSIPTRACFHSEKCFVTLSIRTRGTCMEKALCSKEVPGYFSKQILTSTTECNISL